MKVPKTADLAISDNTATVDNVLVDAPAVDAGAEAPVAEPTAVAPPEVPAAAPESPATVPPMDGPGDGDAPVGHDESEPLEVPSEEVVQALRPCDLSIKPLEDSELLSVTHLPSGEVREMTREELNRLLRG